MQNPDGNERNQSVYYTDDIVFDKMFHGGKNTIFAA